MKSLVTPEWLHKNLKSVRTFDVTWFLPGSGKDAEKIFKRERIPGSLFWDVDIIADQTETGYNNPHNLPDVKLFEKYMSEFGLEQDDHVVVYDHYGVATCPRAFFMLKYFGHENVAVLNGKKSGFEIETDEPIKFNASVYKVKKIREELFSGIDTIKEVIKEEDHSKGVVFDARANERYTGKAKEPRPVPSGHMPNSINLPWANFVEDGKFKSKEKILDIVNDAHDIKKNEKYYFSCGSGLTACLPAFVFKEILGHENISIYDGSWGDYASRKDSKIIKDI